MSLVPGRVGESDSSANTFNPGLYEPDSNTRISHNALDPPPPRPHTCIPNPSLPFPDPLVFTILRPSYHTKPFPTNPATESLISNQATLPPARRLIPSPFSHKTGHEKRSHEGVSGGQKDARRQHFVFVVWWILKQKSKIFTCQFWK